MKSPIIQEILSRRRFLGITSVAAVTSLATGRRAAAASSGREFRITVRTAPGHVQPPRSVSDMLDDLTKGIRMEYVSLTAVCDVNTGSCVEVRVTDPVSGQTVSRSLESQNGLDAAMLHHVYAAALSLAIRLAPNEQYLVRAFGDYYLSFKQHDVGIHELTALRHAHPQSAPLAFQLGILCDRSGRKSEATTAFMDAHVLNPEDAVTVYNLGVLAAETGQQDAAARWFQEALVRDPDMVSAGIRMKRLSHRKFTLE